VQNLPANAIGRSNVQVPAGAVNRPNIGAGADRGAPGAGPAQRRLSSQPSEPVAAPSVA
jgi:hypothetical protein